MAASVQFGTKTKLYILLATIGTDGDILPYVAVGAKLRERGHQVTLAAGANYQSLAAEHDFDFCELLSLAETDQLMGDPDFWHPFKGALVASRAGVKMIPRQYQQLREFGMMENLVIVSSPALFAAQMVIEKFGVPSANLVMQPWMLPSSFVPPVMPGLPFLRWLPRPLRKLFWRLLDEVGDRLVSRTLNVFRAEHSLPPVRRIFSNWLSRELVLGMFPEWYGARQPDWPAAFRYAGFPLFSGGKRPELSRELMHFHASGPPPIVFTLGTGLKHGASLYHAGVEAIRLLGRRAIFLTKFREQLPATLPPNIFYAEFAPFEKLFPISAAVVHHGGIGTTSQALRAGIPQLVLPIAFDQLDNALKVKSMGAGLFIKTWRATPGRIAQKLEQLRDVQFKVACERLTTNFTGTDPAVTAAEAVEQLGGRRYEKAGSMAARNALLGP